MKNKKEHKHDDFIPSPFPAVTQYENAFIRAWNENTAKAVADVLKYIANATAVAIKTGEVGGQSVLGEVEDNIEKAHQVGDIHPNGKWVWTQLPSGKFDWRVIKKKNVVIDWGVLPEIDKLQTSGDCQKFVENLGYVSYSSNIKDVDTKSAKLITSALIRLHDKIPYQRVRVRVERLKNATMDATDGERIRINSDYFTAFDPSKYWHRTNDKYVARNKAALKHVENQIAKTLEANSQADVSKLTELKNKLAKNIATCPRWTYGHEDTLAADIFLHEMGHILNAQCTGGCGHWKNPIYSLVNTEDERKIHKELNDERNQIFQRYLKEEKYLSEYSTTKAVEAFAEWFVAWLHEDKELPSYIKNYMDKYFKITTPKR